MESNIWQSCEGDKFISTFSYTPWRVVEAQHISSSRDLVDSIEEHIILEDLLESSKPDVNQDSHYLIFTPFRYPPLEYGSRFGKIHEPSIWYGALNINTAFSEVAYYRLKFLADTEANLGYIDIPLTAFSSYLETNKGIDLTIKPFNEFKDDISNKQSYIYSQQLGVIMRDASVKSFIYYSARDKNNGKNIAAFTADVFIKKNASYIKDNQSWRCLASKNTIEFERFELTKSIRLAFSTNDFMCY
jgi:hypothetical protein